MLLQAVVLWANPLPADTETLLEQRGHPDLKVPVTGTSRDDYLLLYEGDADDPSFEVNDVYYVDEDLGLTHRIRVLDAGSKPKRARKRRSDDEESWYREMLRDARASIRDLKERKEALDREIHEMPGLNYFDRVDLLSKDLEVGWGKSHNETRTTLAFDTSRDTLSLTFEVPL